jgi:hypothetical protein
MGASGESFSAPGQLAVEGLLAAVRQPPFPSRLADYWLAVEAGLARGQMDAANFTLLDMADGSGGQVTLATQRREHLEMWLLLGDPALRLPVVPVSISLQAAQPAGPGKYLEISGILPDGLQGATVHVSLERPLSSAPIGLDALPPNSPANREARERAFMARHQSANTFVLTTAETRASTNHFAASIKIPVDLPWTNVVIRASATLSNEAAIGVITLDVKH